MMDTERKTSTLQRLLSRIQGHRAKPTGQEDLESKVDSGAAQAPAIEKTTVASVVQAPATKLESPHRVAPPPPPRPQPSVPAPSAAIPKGPVHAPAPLPPSTPQEVITLAPSNAPYNAAAAPNRVFEATPVASGQVAYIEGKVPDDWSLSAVLSRAFRLTPG